MDGKLAVEFRSTVYLRYFAVTCSAALLMCAGNKASAQVAVATATPTARPPIFARPTPPGVTSARARQARRVVTPAIITPRASAPAASAAAAAPAAAAIASKLASKLPKATEITVKSTPGKKSVHITWKAPDGVSTLTLERAESETGPFSAVAILASPEGNFDDENSVFAGTTYYYRLISQFEGYDGGLVSGLSSPVQVIMDRPEGTSLDAATTAGHGAILPSNSTVTTVSKSKN